MVTVCTNCLMMMVTVKFTKAFIEFMSVYTRRTSVEQKDRQNYCWPCLYTSQKQKHTDDEPFSPVITVVKRCVSSVHMNTIILVYIQT